jgi:hypothetical protein
MTTRYKANGWGGSHVAQQEAYRIITGLEKGVISSMQPLMALGI